MNTPNLPNLDMDLDRLEQQTSQMYKKTLTYMNNLVDSHKTVLSEKRRQTLAKKDAIKEKQEEVDRLTQDRLRYEFGRKDIMALEAQAKDLEIKLDKVRTNQEQTRRRIVKQEIASATVKNKANVSSKITGLVSHPIKENHLKFDFTLIDKHQPDKVFTFTLHMADGGIYKVEECDPMVPNLDTLTENLNQHRDAFLFIKLIRREFCALASSSTLPVISQAATALPATLPEGAKSPETTTSVTKSPEATTSAPKSSEATPSVTQSSEATTLLAKLSEVTISPVEEQAAS